MDPFSKKKWASFEEMKSDLANEVALESPMTKGESDEDYDLLTSKLFGIVELAQNAKDCKDFFDANCKLSLVFEDLTDVSIRFIFDNTNLYVLLLNAVFRNEKFQQELIKITEDEIDVFGIDASDLNLESKIFINSGISLAFFSIATGLAVLKETNIDFLRNNLTNLVKIVLRGSAGKNTFANLCYKLEGISWDNRYQFKGKFPVRLNDKKLFETLRIARSLSGVSFLSLTINSALANQFSKIIEVIDTEHFSLSKAMSGVYGVIYRLEESKKSYFGEFPHKTASTLESFFQIFIRKNERNLLFFLKNVSADFQFQRDVRFFQITLNKVSKSEFLAQELISYAKVNLSAFEGDIGEERYEWSNKVFIASLRLLSVLSAIQVAKDERWKVSTAIHEFVVWINDVHEILNKHSIEDDWVLIMDSVIEENVEVEWKSTFYTPLEQPFENNDIDAGIGKKLFGSVVRAILGMLNTKGGVLIVGLIENPDAISREELKRNVISKNGKVFFDIGSELKKLGKTLDHVRLQIFDSLKHSTDNSQEKFNNLIKLEPVLLKSGDSVATIIKITVNKGEKPFFNVKKENSSTWISLTMRAQGQTIDVDVRDYV